MTCIPIVSTLLTICMILKEDSGEAERLRLTRCSKTELLTNSIGELGMIMFENAFWNSSLCVANTVCSIWASKLTDAHWFSTDRDLILHTTFNYRETRKDNVKLSRIERFSQRSWEFVFENFCYSISLKLSVYVENMLFHIIVLASEFSQ